MKRVHLKHPVLAILAALFLAAAAHAQTTGYWQYVKTDSYIQPYSSDTAYPDTHSGSEGLFSVVITEPSVSPVPTLGSTFAWSAPPSVLIPNTALYWPVSATVDQSIPGRFLGISFIAEMYPYQPVSNLATVSPWASTTYATVGTDWSMTVGTKVNYNNALVTSPVKIPAGSSTWMDANGLMTILTWINGSSTYYWSYVYKWTPGTLSSCGGTCTLAAPGQTIGSSGGPGSVAVTATSSWSVTTVDSWIQLTSPVNGSGNTTVTFTVTANPAKTSRNGTIVIGGLPYTISQDGSASGTKTGQGGLGTTNVALNKPVTISSKYPTKTGNPAAITDGSFTSAWYAYQGAPNYCSLVVDLGQTYSIGRIDLGLSQVFDYQVYGSTDGTTYAQLASQTWPVSVSMPVSIAVNGASSARYIKYECHAPWNQYVGIWGLRVYEWLTSAPDSPDPSFYGATDVAKGKPVQNASATYTSDSKNPPANVVDGSTSTAWYGANGSYLKDVSPYDFYVTTGMVQIDLGQSVTLGKIVITPAKAQAFGVYLTADNAALSSTATYLFSSDPSKFGTSTFSMDPQTFYVDGRVSARYLWLVAWNETPGGTPAYPGIDEIEVYSFGGGTCSLGSPGQPMAATGGPGTVAVTATSSWTAAAVDSWLHLTSPATGAGNSTVSFTADANGGAPRAGTLNIGNQTYTIYQNGTPTGTTTGCAYLIQSNTTQSVPSTGTTSGLIQVVTAQTCSWTASTSTSWITLRSGTTSTGNGAVAYTVPQNDTTSARSGGILIAGQYVAVDQAAGAVTPPPGTPVVSTGGVVNTASYAPGGPPNGSLAQGSFFSIYGSSLGPGAPAQATTYPLPTNLGGVSITITAASNTYSAYLVFVSAVQINAVLPSNVPVGSAQLAITYGGLTSQPATITVAKTSFGVFFQQVNGTALAIAQNVNSATDYPLNLPSTPAKPGQIVIFWGTGLGPIAGADNLAPSSSGAGDMTTIPVAITVGGLAAQRLYAGRQAETAAVDNVYFTVPNGVGFNCQVPVVITAGGVAANTTNIAITADGSPCQ